MLKNDFLGFGDFGGVATCLYWPHACKWKCLSVVGEHRDFYQQHQTSPFLSHTAFAFLYGLFDRELVVHSVYRITTVSSCRCRVRSSYCGIYNHPPFSLFTRQTHQKYQGLVCILFFAQVSIRLLQCAASRCRHNTWRLAVVVTLGRLTLFLQAVFT